METIARFGLQHQRTVILEGILSAARYGDMLKTLIAEADQSLVYYYDLSFDETLRRHAHRAKAKEFGADVMRDWYLPHDRLNVPTEQLISADWSQTMVVNHILTDLAGLNNTESVKPIH
ncbi:hypothetical protein Lpp126_05515 [Lacticaseibacillus paracasei subsp. paracasei Lpp126]|uniref:Kinase n=1 Tax=Lacticaseibacillus paracasei subsp. paracasei Lpp126 TaxID=1256206 RepID=S2RUJ9_LACPA|nr:hypothetical protein Lpp126_05515 [Lacticaseibacillus paracasei subsp. paracasei Lpp126]